jgi:hypothetical protein
MDVVRMMIKSKLCERVHFYQAISAPIVLLLSMFLYIILGLVAAWYITYLYLKEEPVFKYATTDFIVKDKRWRYNAKKMEELRLEDE